MNAAVLYLGLKLSVGTVELSSDTTRSQINALVQDQVVGFLQGSFDGGDKVEILVDGSGGGQISTSSIGGGISNARALCPSLVALDTRQGTGVNVTSGAGVFDRVDVTVSSSQQ